MFTTRFASEIEGPKLGSPLSSISENESADRSFFSFVRETISSSLRASDAIKSSSQHSNCLLSKKGKREKAFMLCFSNHLAWKEGILVRYVRIPCFCSIQHLEIH
ncbi:hypothetical protein AVEN_146083-1 [Araneus ventricosus]|uniref:Uncharacterized protein n=1 Tax=Araneus ventricosus TaxID=182803 RepID=A0A4Y2GR89_ARAVE|nr:hypothetical protein AVEN_146083-1 [Araneus ventricosus]